MCAIATANLIVEILAQMILDGNVFTAFDVTLAVRDKNDGDTVMHNDVRNIVNNEFIAQHMVGYKRELRTLDLPNSPQAFVYYPDGETAEIHPLVSGTATVPDNTDDGDTTVDDLGDDEYKLTAEGRIQIPRNLLSKVTPNAGSYDILVNGTLKSARPDARGDVRVGLRRIGITGDKVKLTVDSQANAINLEIV